MRLTATMTMIITIVMMDLKMVSSMTMMTRKVSASTIRMLPWLASVCSAVIAAEPVTNTSTPSGADMLLTMSLTASMDSRDSDSPWLPARLAET